jgi:hypothetical protein
MLKITNVVRGVVVSGVLIASSAVAGVALAREDAPLRQQDKQTLEQNQPQQSIALVGSVKDGKISKQLAKSGYQNARVQAPSNSHLPSFAFYGK